MARVHEWGQGLAVQIPLFIRVRVRVTRIYPHGACHDDVCL